jgi:hypothetical protein
MSATADSRASAGRQTGDGWQDWNLSLVVQLANKAANWHAGYQTAGHPLADKMEMAGRIGISLIVQLGIEHGGKLSCRHIIVL